MSWETEHYTFVTMSIWTIWESFITLWKFGPTAGTLTRLDIFLIIIFSWFIYNSMISWLGWSSKLDHYTYITITSRRKWENAMTPWTWIGKVIPAWHFLNYIIFSRFDYNFMIQWLEWSSKAEHYTYLKIMSWTKWQIVMTLWTCSNNFIPASHLGYYHFLMIYLKFDDLRTRMVLKSWYLYVHNN